MFPLWILWLFSLLGSPWFTLRTEALPTVRPGCKEMGFETAYYDGPPLKFPLPLSTRIQLRCKERYHDAITHTLCAGMDIWEDPFPSCKLVRCPPVDAVNHGSVNVTSTPGFGDEAHLQCDEDYWYDGTDDVRVCQRNETWTGAWGECQAKATVQCLRPEVNAHMTIVPYQTVYGFRSSIDIRCEVGFTYGGTSKRICQPGNMWTGKDGTCKRIMCHSPLHVDNGRVSPVCNNCPYNTTLTINCDRGFKYNGTSFVCGQNRSWIGSGDCKRIKCDNIPVIKNGFINVSGNAFEDSAVVKCNEGLVYEGAGTITCLHTGIWTHPGYCQPHGPLGIILGILIPVSIIGILAGTLLYLRLKKKMKHNTNNGVAYTVPVENMPQYMNMKEIILKKDHDPERTLDKPINLDTQFIQLKIITEADSDNDLNDTIAADKYKRYIERTNQTDITIDGILQVENNANPVLLLQGRAGVGKTTLIQKLIYLWAKGEWAQDYSLALLFNLRIMISKDQRKYTLVEFLDRFSFYNLKNFNLDEFGDGIEEQGAKWLIFMDAIDEFPHMEERMEKAPILSEGDQADVCTWCINIWRRNILRKSTLLLTSRHIKKLKRLNLDKTIEVVGLTEEKVQEYIDIHVDEKKQQKVKDNLTMNPTLMSVASITFFCMKLCHVFAQDDVTEDVSDLTTYTRITTFLLKMYVKRDFLVNDNADENTRLLVKQLANLPGLARLAFNGLVQNNGTDLAQLIFDGEDLKKAELSNEDVSDASEQALITKIEHSGFTNGETSLVEFAHLSIQEVLAMVHLVSQDVDKISETLGSMWKSSRFSMAQLYLLGLLFDKKCSWIHDITDPESQIVHKTKINSMSRMSQIQERISSLIIQKVSKVDEHQHLRAIQMAYESQNPQVAATIGKSLFGEGEKIKFSSMPLTAVDVNGILFIIKESKCIHSLWLWHMTLDKTSIGLIADFLKEDKMLTDLFLGGNKLGAEGVEKLVPALRDNTTLTSIGLGGNKLGAEGMEKLVPALRDNTTLTSIGLYDNELGAEGMEKLVPALSDNTTLTSINLCGNSIDDKASSSIGRILKENESLEKIQLDQSDLTMTYEGIKNILSGLQVNTNVQELSMDVPHVAPDYIAEFLALLEEVFSVNTVVQLIFVPNVLPTLSDVQSAVKDCIRKNKYYGSRIHL